MPRYVPPRARVTDGLNRPLPGAKLYFYATNTSTAVPTWRDAGLTILNTYPVVADAEGRYGDIFLTPGMQYRVLETTADGVTLSDADPVGDTFPFLDGAGNFPLNGGRLTGVGAPLAEGDAVVLGPDLKVPYPNLPIKRMSQLRADGGVVVPNGTTWRDMTFNVRGPNTLGFASPGAGPYGSFTVQEPCAAIITLTLSWAPNTNGERAAAILVNDVVIDDDYSSAGPGGFVTSKCFQQYGLQPGDTIRAQIFQTSGGNLVAGGNTRSLFTISV